MFSNRKDVDEHVHKMFSKIPPGSERDGKGWAVGRMYSKIREYTKAIEHLNAYLKVNDDAGAHKLIAQCYRQLKSPDYLKAVEHYQRSIQLNPKQTDVIKECCKLLIDNKPLCRPDRLAYWLELADNVGDPHDNNLRLTLRMLSNTVPAGVMEVENSMELLIQKELLKRPHDIVLKVRLLHNYLEHERIDEAFNYAYKIELEKPAQCHSTDWYDVVWTVLHKCEQSKETSKDWAYWQLLLITLDRLIQLSLLSVSSSSLGESIAHLFKLDQYVYKFSLLSENLSINGGFELHQFCLEHYSGQLLLHAATVLFKRELLGNKNKWSNTVRATLPLLLLGYQQNWHKAKPTSWLRHCNSAQQQVMELWRHQAAFRCAQLGRTLHGCLQIATDDGTNDRQDNQLQGLWPNSDELLSTARQHCVDSQWRSQLYQQIYTHPDRKLKEQSSIFIRDQRLQQPLYEWPSVAEIEEHEHLALDLAPPTLELHVYLALGTKNLAEAPRVHFYKAFRRDNRQPLSNCSVDSLTQLDVDVFLYAVVLQAQRKLHVQRKTYNSCNVGNRNAISRPHMLPYANIMGGDELITLEQRDWWAFMQRIHDKNFSENYRVEHREVVQFGLEVLRCQNEPHIEIIMVLQLGKLLASRDDRSNLDARIEAFYRLGIRMMLRQQEQKLEPFYRYFKYAKASANSVWLQIQQLAEEALSYLSRRSFKHDNHREFVKDICGLKLPMATYLQAEAYRQLADSSHTSRLARQNFQDRRIECLKETKAMIVDNLDHPLNSVVQCELKASLADERYCSPELHNNSSAYEDAEDDFYTGASQSLNRSRRHLEIQIPFTLQLEQAVKQMSKQLCVFKEDVGVAMESMRQDIKMLIEKLDTIEDLKKFKINGSCNHEQHSRDVDAAATAAALGLDEFLNMEDAIQTNYLNAVPPPANAQDRFYPPAGTVHPNAAYGSPMFNQNQMYNFFASQAQFMRTPPTAGTVPPTFYGPRGPASFGVAPNMYQNSNGAPFMEGQNYGIAAQPPTLVNSQAQCFNQPSMPIASGATFFNSAQYVQPAGVQVPLQVPQASQQLAQTVQTSLIQQKPTPAAIPSITPAPAPVAAPITTSVAVNVETTTTAVATSTVVAHRGATPVLSTHTVTSPVSSVPGAIFNRVLNNQPVEKNPPANVIITNSDPLPKPVVANTQLTLSVTIPSHHIKPSLVQTTEPPAIEGSDFSFNLGNNNVSTNANNIFGGQSTFSFKPQVAKAAAEKQKELAADLVNDESIGSEANNGLGADISAELDYDPRPDFQGIIPLPDEVVVLTGEEDEQVNFSHRAKLFRHIDKEWKERGIGTIKILTNQFSGCTRILMRRDQTHKICANHKITLGMTLTTPEHDKEEKTFLWAANDFADEKVNLEKFLVRFKLPETAKEFKLAFENAARNATLTDLKPSVFGVLKSSGSDSFVTSTPAGNALTKQKEPAKVSGVELTVDAIVPKTLFGNLTGATNTATISPFANFNFGTATKGKKPDVGNVSFDSVTPVTDKSTTSTGNTAYTTPFNFGNSIFNKPESALQQVPIQPQQDILSKTTAPELDADEEYVPTAQFAPVIPLPELVKVVTGEEDELVLFEHRAKLLRFDKETNEWKERGLGNIKLLQLKTDPTQLRLLMRREQVHKICLNQRLLADTKFNYAKNSQNAITWAGHDYADQELTTELLCVRFKTAETCKEFYDLLIKAQGTISQVKSKNVMHNIQIDKKPNKDVEIKAKGFGDAFKPKQGSWNCQACYTTNDAAQLYCAACENPKDDSVPPKSATLSQSGALNLSSSAGKFEFGFTQQTTAKPSFSLNTKSMLVKPPLSTKPLDVATNPAIKIYDGDTPKNTASKPDSLKAVGFGDAFKPKVGIWSCRDCYLSNDIAQLYCVACQARKDDTVPKKDNNLDGSVGLSFPAHSSKFIFGFGATPSVVTDTSGDSDNAVMPKNNTESSIFDSSSLGFKPTTSAINSNLASNTFSFSMPKVQQHPKSPTGNIGAANVSNDDESHVDEEENNTYFAPVIPLPDKIDVKTGEEDEDLLYVQRAKLYRLTNDGEWKERGLGNVKILRHKEKKNLRVVMRREQVLKICLNHVLNSNVVYKTKDEKTWLFAVYDFSEGESRLERLALRFKNADIAQVFHNTVKSALKGSAKPINDVENQQQPLKSIPSKSEDGTVISNELHTLASTLALSCEFLTSESNCSGCRGCEPEKFNYGQPVRGETAIKPLPLSLPAMKLPPPKNKERVHVQDVVASPYRTLLKATTLASNSTNKSGSFDGFSKAAGSAASPMVTENKSVFLGGGFLFGNAEKPVFGQSASQFGTNATDKLQQSIFAGSFGVDNKLSNQTDSIFGSVVKTQAENQDEASKSVFSPFGNSTSNTNNNCSSGFTFTSTAASSVAPIFGNQAKDNAISFAEISNSKDKAKDNQENIAEPIGTMSSVSLLTSDLKTVNCFSELGAKAGDDFASLAAKGISNPIGFQKSDTGGYFGLTHQDDFKNFKSPGKSTITTAGEDSSAKIVSDDENYDPHYEPIITLPNEIVVCTGEEDELKLFGERATLFRYDSDTKEWKERGVGELKILKHKTLKTHRMILRREQILKLVLNMTIGQNFTLEYMSGQKKSFVWANFNYYESPDGVVERLACRFNKQELADQFRKTIEMCVVDAKAMSSDAAS